uniref:Uncharacterized protein n=1 Tax=Uncultured archaeon GZfos26G2 TaxID=3386331 RepID=Q64AC3_UNCAG|nr:hypothetical protein GZ32E7_15 [uncultured archaeon GZfos32E7]
MSYSQERTAVGRAPIPISHCSELSRQQEYLHLYSLVPRAIYCLFLLFVYRK